MPKSLLYSSAASPYLPYSLAGSGAFSAFPFLAFLPLAPVFPVFFGAICGTNLVGAFNSKFCSSDRPLTINLILIPIASHSCDIILTLYGTSTLTISVALLLSDSSSNVSSLNCNGPSTLGQTNLFLDGLAIAICPEFSEIYISYLSDLSIPLSFKNCIAPCDIIASRSISPILKPPPAERPLGGCLFLSVILPLARELTLSLTICFNL